MKSIGRTKCSPSGSVKRLFFAGLLAWSWLFAAICPGETVPSSAYRYISTGNYYGQFTDEEYQYLADNHAIVMLAKFHGAYDLEKHHEAARQLKQRNPSIKIFPYYGALYWFIATSYGQDDIKEAWYWHDFKDDWHSDPAGPLTHRIAHKYQGQVDAYWINLANANYRDWAVNIIGKWMRLTLENGRPLYDGIKFDNVLLYNVYNAEGLNSTKVNQLVSNLAGVSDPGQAERNKAIRKIKIQNNGLKSLMSEARQAISDRIIVFNGIADKSHLCNRNLVFLGEAFGLDAAANEDFGYKENRLPSRKEMLANLNLLFDNKYRDKIFLLKTNLSNSDKLSQEEKLQIQRYSFGSFLLGHRPGHTYYKYGELPLYWTDGEIGMEPKEINLNFGNPLSSKYGRVENVYMRRYENGRVYVNMLDTAQTVALNQKLVLMNGGIKCQTFHRGDILQIPAKDAVFLLAPKSL